MKILSTVVGVVALLGLAQSASAQVVPTDSTKPIRVFVDCSFFCDLDLIRTEMPWVDYMRDRADAQLHILVTQEATGGGGSQYTLNFIGLKDYASRNDTLRYTASSDDSQDKTRRGLIRIMQIGVLPFISGTPGAQNVKITMADAPTTTAAAAAPKHDPWNFWNFRLGVNGFGQGQTQSTSANYRGSINASRTTEDWKISLGGSASENDQTYKLPNADGTETDSKFVSKSASLNGLAVKSLGSNFSAGLEGDVSTSTYGNTSLSVSLKPAVEYDFFPYKQSSRRMLTAKYAIGVRSFKYREETIYFKTSEAHPQHSLSLGYNTQEQWGSVSLSANYSEYLHDRSFYNAGLFGSTDVRLFKGFSFNVGGDYSRVHDQLGLSAANASLEEILLHQRELKTSFSYFISAGISYRFGSIFNNVVNPRFGGGGGGGGMIMIMN